MAISLKHTKVATLPDEAGAEVNKAEWNAEHVINQAASRMLGIPGAVPGPTEEMTGAQVLAFAGAAALVHAIQHQALGADAIKLDDLAAPDDNIDLNASLTAHGLLQKLPGGTATFLRADGAFASPVSSPDIKAAVITAPYESYDYSEVVADAAVTAANQIILNWGAATDDDENTPDMEDVNFMAVAGTGNFTAKISTPNNNPFGGPFKLNYLIG